MARLVPSRGLDKCSPPDAHVHSILEINGLPSGMSVPHKVEKSWGYELVFHNTPAYCCKLLHLNAWSSCSMHFHVQKHETLVCVSGVLQIQVINNKKSEVYTVTPGQAFVVAPGLPHRLIAGDEAVELIEASTQHFDEDSVKLS